MAVPVARVISWDLLYFHPVSAMTHHPTSHRSVKALSVYPGPPAVTVRHFHTPADILAGRFSISNASALVVGVLKVNMVAGHTPITSSDVVEDPNDADIVTALDATCVTRLGCAMLPSLDTEYTHSPGLLS